MLTTPIVGQQVRILTGKYEFHTGTVTGVDVSKHSSIEVEIVDHAGTPIIRGFFTPSEIALVSETATGFSPEPQITRDTLVAAAAQLWDSETGYEEYRRGQLDLIASVTPSSGDADVDKAQIEAAILKIVRTDIAKLAWQLAFWGYTSGCEAAPETAWENRRDLDWWREHVTAWGNADLSTERLIEIITAQANTIASAMEQIRDRA